MKNKVKVRFDLRSLRTALGWPLAEMARFLRIGTSQVKEWEDQKSCPREVVNQKLMQLAQEMEQSSSRIQQTPSAEKNLADNNLIQVCYSRIAS